MEDRIFKKRVVKPTLQERMILKKQQLEKRFELEGVKMKGLGYELIYPCCDKNKKQSYDLILKKSNEIWDDFTTNKKKR